MLESLGSSRRRTASTLLALCLATALLARLSHLALPFLGDGARFIYMGKVVAEGGRLYQDFFNTKYPSVALLVAPLWMAFGRRWAGYVLAQLILAVGACFLLGWSVHRQVRPSAGYSTLLFALIYLNLSRIVMTGFQLETIQVAAAIVSACFALDALQRHGYGASFAAGLAAGVAAMLKPSGLAVAGALTLALLWQVGSISWRTILGQALALGLGVGLVVGANVAWVASTYLAGEMPELNRQIWLYASETPWRTALGYKTAIFFGLPLFPLAVRWLLTRQEARTHGWGAPLPIVVFACSWLLLEIAGVVLQRRMYAYHFLPIFAPAAVLYGLMPPTKRVVALFAGLMPALLLSLWFAAPKLTRLSQASQTLGVSRYLMEHARPGSAIWGNRCERILIETNLRPGARLCFISPLANYDEGPIELGRILLRDLEQRRPEYIVWRAVEPLGLRGMEGILKLRPERLANYERALGDIWDYVLRHYRREIEIEGLVVYRRSLPDHAGKL